MEVEEYYRWLIADAVCFVGLCEIALYDKVGDLVCTHLRKDDYTLKSDMSIEQIDVFCHWIS